MLLNKFSGQSHLKGKNSRNLPRGESHDNVEAQLAQLEELLGRSPTPKQTRRRIGMISAPQPQVPLAERVNQCAFFAPLKNSSPTPGITATTQGSPR
jgi:hypothetical protein